MSKRDVQTNLNRKDFSQCVFPSLIPTKIIYTSIPKNTMQHKKGMVCMTSRTNIRNEKVSTRPAVKDAVDHMLKLKWRWARQGRNRRNPVVETTNRQEKSRKTPTK